MNDPRELNVHCHWRVNSSIVLLLDLEKIVSGGLILGPNQEPEGFSRTVAFNDSGSPSNEDADGHGILVAISGVTLTSRHKRTNCNYMHDFAFIKCAVDKEVPEAESCMSLQ